MDEQFVVDTLQVVLKDDSLSSSHPISNDVTTPKEIDAAFDNVSYNKGAYTCVYYACTNEFLLQHTLLSSPILSVMIYRL